MSNPSPATRFPQQCKWNAGKTTTIRVPEALKEEILELARKLDEQYKPTTN